MKRFNKHLLSVGLASALAIAVIPATNVYAFESDSPEDTKINWAPEHKVMTYEEREEPAPTAVVEENDFLGLPSKYPVIAPNTKNLGLDLPDVRNQNPYGTCWIHSCIACVEGGAYYNNLGDAKKDIDLSEWHSGYYFYNYTGKNNISKDIGEYTTQKPNDPKYQNAGGWADFGGNSWYGFKSMMQWKGAVSENDAVYPSSDSPNYFIPEIGENEYALYHLKEFKIVYPQSNPEIIKDAIFKNGMVSVSYYFADKYDRGDCYYCDKEDGTNHAVTIVGWDDNYPASNFAKTNVYIVHTGSLYDDPDNPGTQLEFTYNILSINDNLTKEDVIAAGYPNVNSLEKSASPKTFSAPKNNGAWLVRNSWGETGTSPDMRGYFWLSYEDTSISNARIPYVNYAYSDPSNIYQYDGTVYQTDHTFSTNQLSVANVFKAQFNKEGNEELKRVAFETSDANLNYSIQLYAFNEDFETTRPTPDSGTALLDSPITGRTDALGYYAVNLPEGIVVKEGTYYSVVITYTTDENSITLSNESPSDTITKDFSEESGLPENTIVGTFKWSTDIQPAQSYFKDDRCWYDLYSDAEDDSWKGNLPIKAYTDNTTKETTIEYPEVRSYNFKDVPEGKWYTDAVKYMFNAGFMAGKSETKFAPDDKCSREEFVQILANTNHVKEYSYRIPFEDVVKGKWYENAVMWAYGNNIISGISSTEFGIGQNVTREQVAVLLMNYAKMDGVDTAARADLSSFKDAKSVSGWAKNAMSWANKHNIIKGAKGNKLNPQGEASRAEIAQMFCNYAAEFWK